MKIFSFLSLVILNRNPEGEKGDLWIPEKVYGDMANLTTDSVRKELSPV